MLEKSVVMDYYIELQLTQTLHLTYGVISMYSFNGEASVANAIDQQLDHKYSKSHSNSQTYVQQYLNIKFNVIAMHIM